MSKRCCVWMESCKERKRSSETPTSSPAARFRVGTGVICMSSSHLSTSSTLEVAFKLLACFVAHLDRPLAQSGRWKYRHRRRTRREKGGPLSTLELLFMLRRNHSNASSRVRHSFPSPSVPRTIPNQADCFRAFSQ